jgi:hypothetical protein
MTTMMNNEAIVLEQEQEMITYGFNVWKDVMIIYKPTFTLLDEITWLKQNYINNDIRMVKKIFDNCYEGEGMSYNIEFDKVDDIEEGEEKDDIVFACALCCVNIKRNSPEHDNCKTANGDNWFCEDCDIPDEEDEEDGIYYLYKCKNCKWITSDDDPVCEMCNKTGMMMVEATPAIYDDTDCDEDEE